MSEKIKCPHCAKVIDFGKLAKQNKPDSVTSMSVYAGVIRKDIPAYVDEFYGNDDSKVCKAGREFSVTLSNLTQTKAITLIFLIERDGCHKEQVVFSSHQPNNRKDRI